jgi:hypothetical protein
MVMSVCSLVSIEKSVVVIDVGSDMPVVMEEAVRAAKMPLSGQGSAFVRSLMHMGLRLVGRREVSLAAMRCDGRIAPIPQNKRRVRRHVIRGATRRDLRESR